MSTSPEAILQIASNPTEITQFLFNTISKLATEAISDHGCFSIALSGGSLPKFLSGLSNCYAQANLEPQFGNWHVLLADERCVPSTNEDSNLKNIQEKFLQFTTIPSSNVYGIDESLLENGSTLDIAASYESILQKILDKCNGSLDCILLGFGPDGHTCSLFPNHSLLKEDSKLVTSLDDSPKPPPNRITLTYPVLNQMARGVVFCGTGSSKGPILKGSFGKIQKVSESEGGVVCHATMNSATEDLPVTLVRPKSSVIWVVDKAATEVLGIE